MLKNKFLGLGVLALGLFAIGFGISKVGFDASKKDAVQEISPSVLYTEPLDDIDIEIQIFINEGLHFNDVVIEDTGSGKCKENKWYESAKDAYRSLSEDAKNRLADSNNYGAARERFQAWATANNEVIDFANHSFSNDEENKGNSVENKIIVLSIAGGMAVGVSALVIVVIVKARG